MTRRGAGFLNRFRRRPDRAYWIPRTEGFRVESSDGELGTVEEVRFASDGGRPTELAVRGRALGSRRLALIGVEDVVKIIPGEQRVVVRGTGLPVRFRLLASITFAATAAAFLFPFLTVTLERRAEATGIDLVADNPSITGSYVHANYVGDVELLVGRGHVPAIVTFGLAVLGILGAWIPGRKAIPAGLLAAILGLIGMWALWMTTTAGPELFASSYHRYGFWLAVGLFLCSGAASLLGRRAFRT
jgi:hypothetical protein